MNAYHVMITEPIQIPGIVYEALRKGEGEEFDVVLRHEEEPNIARGRGQPFSYYGRTPEYSVVRRPDGNLTWYHNRTTGCLMHAGPFDLERDTLAGLEESWKRRLTGLAEEWGFPENEWAGNGLNDLYVRDDGIRQLFGASYLIGPKSAVSRACWYDSDPRSDYFDEMLLFDRVNPLSFHNRIAIPSDPKADNLAESLEARKLYAGRVISQESAEKARRLQEEDAMDSGKGKISCVMSGEMPNFRIRV